MTNFLGLRCPRCRRDDGIDIQAKVWVRVCDDGMDADASENRHHDYTPCSPAMCSYCFYLGRLSDFKEEDATEEQAVAPTLERSP